jgi:hypothetical protein
MSTEAAIQKGKGIVANPAFLMIFTLVACVLGAGSFTALLSFLDFCITHEECGSTQVGGFQAINFVAIILLIIIAILFGVAWFTGLKENLFIGLIVLMGIGSGFLADGIVVYMWGIEHDEWLIALVLAVVIGAIPPIVLILERYGILPLFVAFAAAVWGVLSIFIFVLAVIIGVEPH